ncbi:MAG: hypothetical protein IT449_10485 [Phycisphaerales bacterium]|nr:hypothetical protein [Phycisphaerales bacterium]
MGVNYREQYERRQLEPFWPNEIIKMTCAVLFTMAVIMFFAVLPVLLELASVHGVMEQEEPANARITPPHIRPEWYFLSVYQYLKLMPAQLVGIEGSALGVLTQGVGIVVLLLLPWWHQVADAGLDRRDLRRAVAALAVAFVTFVVASTAVVGAYQRWSANIGPWLHPAFWLPALAVFSWAGVYLAFRRAGFVAVGSWLRVLSVALLFVVFQGVVYLIVLGQGLSHVVGAWAGYGLGTVLFLTACAWMLSQLSAQWTPRAGAGRTLLFWFVVTENIALFLGLMLWARWPQGGWLDEAGALTHEARQLLMMGAVVLIVLLVFSLLIAMERRSIRRVLGAPTATGRAKG